MGQFVLNENRKPPETEKAHDCLVSVIIPVFNEIQFLNEALESVLNQSYKRLEIIIIDDGSTDGSGEICDEYSLIDNRIRVIHQTNAGLSAARNIGLDIAKGDFIAFIDSDDAYHFRFIEIMVNTAVREKADIVVCKYSVHHTMKKMDISKFERTKMDRGGGVYNRIECINSLVDGDIDSFAWNKLYRRELWNNIRFPYGRVYEDFATTYKVINNSTILCTVDQPLYYYRKHEGSITGSFSQKNVEDRIIAGSEFISFIEENVPEIFTIEQLAKRQRSNLNAMIRLFLNYYNQNSRLKTLDKYGENLRHQIIDTGTGMNVKKCRLRTRIGYKMICYCPLVLTFLYRCYLIGDSQEVGRSPVRVPFMGLAIC